MGWSDDPDGVSLGPPCSRVALSDRCWSTQGGESGLREVGEGVGQGRESSFC